jgi:hypothetical protein
MFKQQNYSATPNELIDDYLNLVSGSELKLILLIIRQTVGWHKSNDWITTSQYMVKTGLSNRCVIDGLRSLEAKKLIKTTFICDKCKTPSEEIQLPFECPICSSKEYPTKYYQLNVNYEGLETKKSPEGNNKSPSLAQKVLEGKEKQPEASEESSQPTALKVHDPVKKVHNPCEESSQPPMNLVHIQKKLLKETLTKSI